MPHKTKWMGAAAWSAKEARAGDRLPYLRLIDESTLLLRDGSVMTAIQVPGLLFETEDSEALNAHAATREVVLRSTLDARFVLYHHVIRRRVSVDLEAEFPDPISRHIDACWRDRLGSGQLFVNDQFITLIRRPARGKAGLVERVGRKFRRQDGDRLEPDPKDLRSLRAASQGLVAALSAYGATPLGEYTGPQGSTNSEMLELLSALYNGEMRPVRKPADDVDIGHMLPYRRVSFGLDAIETRGSGAPEFAAMLGMKDYPEATSPGLLDSLLRLPFEMVVSESYAPTERQTARERMDLAIRRLKSADEEAAAERADMLAARDALGNGAVGFGDHHLTVMVRERQLGQLDDAMAACAAALADTGAIAVREDTNLEPAFWGQFPGNEAYLVRRALISSANMASFGSLHGFALGQAQGNHWGEAVTLLETTSATPFFFNFHHGDLGNFSVIGPSGSGKTVVMNFLAAQAQKFSPRTILFDKDRGAELFVRGIGGRYDSIRSGEPTGFNPLALPDTPGNRAFLRDWLGVLLKAEGPEEEQTIAAAVDAAYANDASLRRLRHFRELLSGTRRPQPGDLADRLGAWIGAGEGPGGEHAWLFDNSEDRLDLGARVLGFDMTALLENPRLRTPTMMYLFHRIEERLDGKPTMILIDEGWKALDDEVFAARIRDWLKTLRKRNALVGFATQSARDALESRISTALVEQTATMVFMPNSRARPEDYCDGFGLTEHELALIRTLPAHSRCFLVRQPDASVVVRLDLSGAPEVLTLLSGRESSVRRLDLLREALGDAPSEWFPALTGTRWPGGANDEGEAGVEALRLAAE
ncbi:MAG TPA: VirB4 family type IV secretion/conjugal transfer ATPase [Erythrobacter sp.]|jgi:type IV secretion system protein VirB4|uniref:VirB4 family type IV secretion/conjugal transfer ATPase n=1 Tax=unclassified Erythrobacter TaxID=2633097 RepID=UPI0007B95E29|nr:MULTISPECIES: VirB4 family type IV secretion/conjugal transfer ATPase [unclassified Erythrobacter]MCZ4264957.1 VirB4 family type IV secretion/conjugal transfer ATPase [Erythrobacter sp. G21629-S1]HAL90549.1 VirB4 family type IV secretion/conjugal transfer ATPase [Erythrobacter sp.]KZX86083.1 type VI secretion protein [Erythrobacter sp. HI0019]KZY08850.1 type VI secretion protein [Erythrobacter sp. HI0028]KZY90506.1 type VI secretion protein [Erythrobacter sp. HI0074]|tara:strand:- start:1078 stop:3531 length:2454 start_codon:yes stop_codon:yes gene_type:complete